MTLRLQPQHQWTARQLHNRLQMSTAIAWVEQQNARLATRPFDRSAAITQKLQIMFLSLSLVDCQVYEKLADLCTKNGFQNTGGARYFHVLFHSTIPVGPLQHPTLYVLRNLLEETRSIFVSQEVRLTLDT